MKKLLFFFSILVLPLFTLSCGGGSSSGGGGTNSVTNYSSYSDLYTYNASALGGHTVRWETPITVYTGGSPNVQALFGRWGLPFTFDNSSISSSLRPNAIVVFGDHFSSNNILAETRVAYYTSGKIFAAGIFLNANRSLQDYIWNTMEHEIGHAIGFFGHTSDGGLMDAYYNGSNQHTSTVSGVISLLYSLPIGSDIRTQLGFKSMLGGRYQPNGTEIITKVFHALIPRDKSK